MRPAGSRAKMWAAWTAGERLNARVREITQEHRAKPLDEDRKQQVLGILAQAAG